MSQTEDQASRAMSPKKSTDGNPGRVSPRRSDSPEEADGAGGTDEGDVQVDGLTADGRLPGLPSWNPGR